VGLTTLPWRTDVNGRIQSSRWRTITKPDRAVSHKLTTSETTLPSHPLDVRAARAASAALDLPATAKQDRTPGH
jgi:hypothetical protein